MNIVVFEADRDNKVYNVSCEYDTYQEKTIKCSNTVTGIDFSKSGSGCEIDITLGANVRHLSRESFSNNTSLTTIDLRNVTDIPYRCFYQCSKLNSVTGINNVTSVGNEAFANCEKCIFGLDNSTLVDIGNRAFWRCFGLGAEVNLQKPLR